MALNLFYGQQFHIDVEFAAKNRFNVKRGWGTTTRGYPLTTFQEHEAWIIVTLLVWRIGMEGRASHNNGNNGQHTYVQTTKAAYWGEVTPPKNEANAITHKEHAWPLLLCSIQFSGQSDIFNEVTLKNEEELRTEIRREKMLWHWENLWIIMVKKSTS